MVLPETNSQIFIEKVPGESSEKTNVVQVLVVDDQPLVREGLFTVLSTEPSIKVIGEAASGLEGVKLACALKPDVILMDIEMPGELDGLSAARLLKSQYPDGEVLMLTFHDGQEYLRQALKSGASGYITKDMARTELINAVLTVARGGSLIQPSMLRNFIQDLAQNSSAFAFPGSSINQNDTAATAEILKKLTRREREVLTLIGEGLNNSSISTQLTISQDTVKSHVRSILEKLNVNDRTQAAVLAVRMGLTGK